ncbi:polysaccharide deacetylase family protein, partial [Clostridium frigidicarnis]
LVSVLVIGLGGILVTQSFLNRDKNKENVTVQASKEEDEKLKEEQKIEAEKELLKNSNMNKDGLQYAVDVHDVRKMLDGQAEKDGKKMVFLTFDDGPSTTVTPKILDTLKQYNVKATFFLVGNAVDNEKHKDLVNRIYDEGHAIGNHSYTHDYKKIYPGNSVNIESFFQEINQTNASIKKILGDDFNTRVIRMPGGYMSRKHYKDPSLPALDAKLSELDMDSIDWNALSGDAEGKKRTPQELVERVKKTVTGQEKAVILMHDTYGKGTTAEALPQVIEWLQSEGYEFKTIK